MAILTVILLIGMVLFALVRQVRPVGYPLDDRDPDARRVAHDVDAIRTRFERHPVWPSPGTLGEHR